MIRPPEEVLPLCDAIEPVGLAILLDHVPPAKQLDELFAQMCKRFGVAKDTA